MKKLGVGLVKRKLANSVSPVNVIIINDDGSYTVRTETTVRTTELNFELGVPFKEETLDGRITNTTATRVGNVLTLDQKGKQRSTDLGILIGNFDCGYFHRVKFSNFPATHILREINFA